MNDAAISRHLGAPTEPANPVSLHPLTRIAPAQEQPGAGLVGAQPLRGESEGSPLRIRKEGEANKPERQ
jgi:hypothetical protein